MDHLESFQRGFVKEAIDAGAMPNQIVSLAAVGAELYKEAASFRMSFKPTKGIRGGNAAAAKAAPAIRPGSSTGNPNDLQGFLSAGGGSQARIPISLPPGSKANLQNAVTPGSQGAAGLQGAAAEAHPDLMGSSPAAKLVDLMGDSTPAAAGKGMSLGTKRLLQGAGVGIGGSVGVNYGMHSLYNPDKPVERGVTRDKMKGPGIVDTIGGGAADLLRKYPSMQTGTATGGLGALLGAGAGYALTPDDEENPQQPLIGAAVGAGLGGLGGYLANPLIKDLLAKYPAAAK